MSLNYTIKVPKENSDYEKKSNIVCKNIYEIIENEIKNKNNRIFIRTNLKLGLPLENINKVAGPFVEAWALEKFQEICDDLGNKYGLINVEGGKRLDFYDMILQFKIKKDDSYITASVDSKATSEDIPKSGKSPNITSFAKVRTEYLNDPDCIFIVLSLKHKVYTEKSEVSNMTNGIMEVVSHNVYDLKYVSSTDISYNPALGTGQIQIKDIHYVTRSVVTVDIFLQMLDQKYIKSNTLEKWLILAKKFNWITYE
jgi:hypothetical protein